jgi:hypothetical protein
LFKSKLG